MACFSKARSTSPGGGRRIKPRHWLLCGCACLWLAPAVRSQPPPTSAEQQPAARIAVRVELVNLDVTVTDSRGNYVRDLRREDFSILDEGRPQPITNFAPVEAPAQVLLLVETGPAVYLIHRQHLTAAHLLLRGLAADDAVALATYDSGPQLKFPFTTDKLALQGRVAGLRYSMGRSQLNLFGSLASTLDWLAATPGKKSIVLLTTGLDDSFPSRWEALLEKLRASEAAVYPVALGGELREPPPKGAPVSPDALQVSESFARANEALKTIAEISGGRAFFPRRAEDFPGIYKQIATILRHTYRLGFTPPANDGAYHRVEVRLAVGSDSAPPSPRVKPSYRVAFRQGYIAPK